MFYTGNHRFQPASSCTKTNSESPFYFQLCRNIKDNIWNIKQAIGKNTLSKFVKTVCGNAGKERRNINNRARKTTVNSLVNAVVPPTQVLQISGHKNVQFYTL